MTAAADRNRLISRLHVMKRDQGLDDDLYRDKLEALTGKRSAGELDEAQLADAVKRFGAGAHANAGARLPASPQQRMIQAQWLSLYNLGAVHDRSDAAILAFIRRQTGLDAAQWLKRHEDVVKVTEALKDWLAREGVDWTSARSDASYTKLPAFKVAVAQWDKLIGIGAVTRGTIWNGNAKASREEVTAYALGIKALKGEPSQWINREWAEINRALGHKLRAALKQKEKAA